MARVKAVRDGFFGGEFRKTGTEFECATEVQFSEVWMELCPDQSFESKKKTRKSKSKEAKAETEDKPSDKNEES